MQTSNLNDLTSFIGFPFRDPNWQNKLLVAAGVGLAAMIIPVLPLVVLAGYAARLANRMLEAPEGSTPQLPEWDDWGGMFMDGLRVTAALLMATLPIVLASLVVFGMLLTPAFVVDSTQASGEVVAMVVVMLGFVVTLLIMLLGLALSVMTPPAILHVIARRSFAALFDVKGWFGIWRANIGGFLLSWVLVMIVSTALGMALTFVSATVILLCVAPFLMGAVTAYLALLQAGLGAREYRIGRERVWQRLGIYAAPPAPVNVQARVAEPAEAVDEVILPAALVVEAEPVELVEAVAPIVEPEPAAPVVEAVDAVEEIVPPAETAVEVDAPIVEMELDVPPVADSEAPAETPGDVNATMIFAPPPVRPEEGEEKT